MRVRLATQRKSLRKFNLPPPLATTCESVCPRLKDHIRNTIATGAKMIRYNIIIIIIIIIITIIIIIIIYYL